MILITFHQACIGGAGFDGNSELHNHDEVFNHEDIMSWIGHPSVLQGGELTDWPKLVNGDNQMLTWLQETKRVNKKVEGHLPGASERTLSKINGNGC